MGACGTQGGITCGHYLNRVYGECNALPLATWKRDESSSATRSREMQAKNRPYANRARPRPDETARGTPCARWYDES